MQECPVKLSAVSAGLSGLTAAFEARPAGVVVTIVENDPRYVGGISRTVGHRFFSKSDEVRRWRKERLTNDFNPGVA